MFWDLDNAYWDGKAELTREGIKKESRCELVNKQVSLV
jgi:hypothetical protein